MRLASEVIINEIKENPNKNFVMSPLSSNCLTYNKLLCIFFLSFFFL